MSGQCLSPSETGHALTPANHLRLGRPLPHQQANSKQTAPRAINLWSGDIIQYYSRFRMAILDPWVRIYSLLSLSPLSILEIGRSFKLRLLARLACLIHAANVHSEPGSNPSISFIASTTGRNRQAVGLRLFPAAKEPKSLKTADSKEPAICNSLDCQN